MDNWDPRDEGKRWKEGTFTSRDGLMSGVEMLLKNYMYKKINIVNISLYQHFSKVITVILAGTLTLILSSKLYWKKKMSMRKLRCYWKIEPIEFFLGQFVEAVCYSDAPMNVATPPKPPPGNVCIQSITPLRSPDCAISSQTLLRH